MANPAADYEMIAVRSGGSTTRSKTKGAPADSKLIAFGKKHHAKAVIRYFPSKRGWRILDIRKAIEVGGFSSRKFWTGQVRSNTYFPNEDAAIMAAIHLLD